MDTRAAVYSPLQNTAVWLSAWLYGATSSDEIIDAFRDLGGRHSYCGEPVVRLLGDIRTHANPLSLEPVVQLVLWGPGQAAGLRAESAAMAALGPAGAIVIKGEEQMSHILVPDYSEEPEKDVRWQWFDEPERLPEPSWLSPGEADAMLSEVTRQAAILIEAAGGARSALPNPRLTVGTLADFYDTPGLPRGVTPRAAKLFARADQVAAIIETVIDRAGEHSFDPELLKLCSYIRTARMAGVANAVSDYRREYSR